MAFVTGLMLIDAPASALNNSDQSIPGARTENSIDVKYIHTKQGDYPYVSAQAFRAWLRNSIQQLKQWEASPIYRDEKVAYTAGNPISYWDDDIFGYMRAPGDATRKVREKDPAYQKLTPLDKDKDGKEKTITRIAPFRVSTLVSVTPVYLTRDYGTMARQTTGTEVNPEADPIPFEHRFYKAILQGQFSVDLGSIGRFTYYNKTGYRNLDNVRKQLAEAEGLIHLSEERAYLLPRDQRIRRAQAIFEGIAHLEGGAKQSIHYTDITPSILFIAVTEGGNNIFRHLFRSTSTWRPILNLDAFTEILEVFTQQILSPIYIGWEKGFLDEEREKLDEFMKQRAQRSQEGAKEGPKIEVSHPRQVLEKIAQALKTNHSWMQ